MKYKYTSPLMVSVINNELKLNIFHCLSHLKASVYDTSQQQTNH